MIYRSRITGLVVTTDRELAGKKWERIDVDDLEVLLASEPPVPAFAGFMDDENATVDYGEEE